ncbi:hypothetical protein AMELA_G00027510 [Ameiurus melas]|uniref:Coenzyme Q-binding protein COQ10 START domain-containing protein n=1 Tax=Ameiurus melas TaxID=219545 RepID=A0A7J6BD45_AMEME|nr:hypothetical protein AMELA_G00027510 [Ameiurus melas]
MATKSTQLFLRALTEISSILRKNSNQPTIRCLSSFGVLGTPSNSLTLFPVMLQSVPTRKFINLAVPILARRMEYSENRTISYSVEQIFSVVANVDQYHQFVPWCKRSKVIKRRNGYVQVELEIGFPLLWNVMYLTSQSSLITKSGPCVQTDHSLVTLRRCGSSHLVLGTKEIPVTWSSV